MTRRPDLPQGSEKEQMVRSMFDRIAPRYDLLNRMMTLGADRVWRRRTVRELGLPQGSLVLDVACGTGDLCSELEQQGHRAIGADFAHEMLVRRHTSAPVVQADALRLPLGTASVDGVTCGFALRNVVDLVALFEEATRVIRPGGRGAFLDVAEPTSKVVRAGHGLYFRKVVPVVGGLLSDREAYRYLPQSTSYLPPTAEIVSMMETAGFEDVEAKSLGLGGVQLLVGTRR
ncbi:MAG: ubiquinone/menaquinone biosynthesis methyltransferase [Actinomycetota bacterium]|nr:ubiquinone/menaquinone biosynthesis methyltransferase [Actinomycetota bacterium]